MIDAINTIGNLRETIKFRKIGNAFYAIESNGVVIGYRHTATRTMQIGLHSQPVTNYEATLENGLKVSATSVATLRERIAKALNLK